ncbi:unnamed protein product [Rotaria socialis]|uniref:Uncharacterized protein n=1 Tax=Rotaria socialis TaxID=392032 RepID=A0A817RMA8_9BILA|nr:unnamed protein product [Rotaria socialis]CAF3253575.1 unnamed protein product [Rotaria socialis]CAF4220230.1 unnamed protein product [Rotaria socialis]
MERNVTRKKSSATDMNIEEVDLQSILASNILELSTFSPIVDQKDDIIVTTPPIVDSHDEAIEKLSAQQHQIYHVNPNQNPNPNHYGNEKPNV